MTAEMLEWWRPKFEHVLAHGSITFGMCSYSCACMQCVCECMHENFCACVLVHACLCACVRVLVFVCLFVCLCAFMCVLVCLCGLSMCSHTAE